MEKLLEKPLCNSCVLSKRDSCAFEYWANVAAESGDEPLEIHRKITAMRVVAKELSHCPYANIVDPHYEGKEAL